MTERIDPWRRPESHSPYSGMLPGKGQSGKRGQPAAEDSRSPRDHVHVDDAVAAISRIFTGAPPIG